MSTHAEMDAVLKARGKIDLRGSKIYVIRTKLSGGLGMAKPCEICQHILFNYGVKRAYYSIGEDEYGVMKIVNPAKGFQ
jgi:deoxycytidylate deaminase